MKKYIISLFVVLFALPTFAQTFANKLIISASKEDKSLYTIYVAGSKECSDADLSNRKCVVKGLYTREVDVIIKTGDITVEQKIILSPKKNDMQTPYNAIYRIVKTADKIELKRKALVNSLKGKTDILP